MPLGAPGYNSRINNCTERESNVLKSDIVQPLKNMDGKFLMKGETLNYQTEY